MSFRLDLAYSEKLIDLLYSNTDAPLIRLGPDGLAARYMDTGHITLLDFKAPPEWFWEYDVRDEVFIEFRMSRKECKALIREAKSAGRDSITFKLRGNGLLMDDKVLGVVDRERKDLPPGIKLELPNRISGWTDFAPKLKRWISDVRKKGATVLGVACLRPDAPPPILDPNAVIIRAYHYYMEEVRYDFTPGGVDIRYPRFGSVYTISFIEQFMPPSVWLRRPYPYVALLFGKGYLKPMAIEMTLGTAQFKAYIASRGDEEALGFLRGLGLLKPLSKDVVMEVVRKYWPEKVFTISNVESALLEEGYDVKGLDKLIGELLDERKLVKRRAGWAEMLSLPETKVGYKPLTEEVVLETIERLCREWDTDAIGFMELEAVLAPEYQITDLKKILHSLRNKGLVDVKPWPDRRKGGSIADLSGYWFIKKKPEEVKPPAPPTPPEEVKPVTPPPAPTPPAPPPPPKGLGPEDKRLLREEFEKILPSPTPEELRELESLLEDLQESLAEYDREVAMRVALEDVRHLARSLLERRLAAPPAPSGVCPVCGKPVTMGVDVWTEYAGQLYHWPCFEKVRPKLFGWA